MTRPLLTHQSAILCLAPLLLALASCSTSSAPPKVEDAPKEAQVTPVEQSPTWDSVVLSTLDQNTQPCTDFYQYACGGWLKETERPADRTRWVRSFDVIREQNEVKLRKLLVETDPKPGQPGHLAKTMWRSCQNEILISDQGSLPLTTLLEQTKTSLGAKGPARATTLANLHQIGVSGLFRAYTTPDPKNPKLYIAALSQSGLGLPDRSYYLESKHAPLLVDYKNHIKRMFNLAGLPEASAADAFGIEKMLAALFTPKDQLRDPDKLYHKMTIRDLQTLAPGLDWKTYFAKVGLASDQSSINVTLPKYITAISQRVASIPQQELLAYLQWQIIRKNAPLLTRAFDQAHFDFYGKRLNNQEKQADRWKRCVRLTDRTVGFDLGQLYVKENFSPKAKDTVQEMVKAIAGAFETKLQSTSWMDPDTQKAAQGKLKTVYDKIGYPDTWRDYSSLGGVTPKTLFANVMAARAFESKRRWAKYGTPVDHKEWYMTPPVVNAYYTPFGNQIVFPAGILQPPFFSEEFPAAMNFGGIGMVIGHEITHGFDDRGRKYGPDGKLEPWWGKRSIENFEERAACVNDYYSKIEVQPTHFINGKLTLGENIADIGGIRLAYAGYEQWKAKSSNATQNTPEGLTDEQLFFVGFAQSWCSLGTQENERVRLLSDSHSPPKWRINATLAHVPEFHKAFACGEGTPMKPKNQCEIW